MTTERYTFSHINLSVTIVKFRKAKRRRSLWIY